MSAIRISSPEQFSAELEKLKGLSTKPPVAVAQPEPSFAPLTLEQVNAKIEEFSLALEGPLPDPVRAEIERRRAALVREQMRLRVGYIPDENGDRPMDLQSIAASATEKVLESLAAAPASTELQSELEPPDVDDEDEDDYPADEIVEVLNGIDAAVPTEAPATITTPSESLQMPQAVVLSPEDVLVLRAALRANLMHTVIKVLSMALQEK